MVFHQKLNRLALLGKQRKEWQDSLGQDVEWICLPPNVRRSKGKARVKPPISSC